MLVNQFSNYIWWYLILKELGSVLGLVRSTTTIVN